MDGRPARTNHTMIFVHPRYHAIGRMVEAVQMIPWPPNLRTWVANGRSRPVNLHDQEFGPGFEGEKERTMGDEIQKRGRRLEVSISLRSRSSHHLFTNLITRLRVK